MKTLKLADGLTLPIETVTQTIAILAKRRAGKSYTMRRLWEQLVKAGQQVVVVDPKGDQWGIRSSADGKSAGLPIVILGGERGDVPLDVGAGELVAKLVVEERVSVLLDLSLFRKREVATFMTAFLEALYRLKAREQYRTPVMLVIDEADAIAPQKPQDGEERMLGAAEDIVRRGGQRGIGCVLVTQRSAVLNKNVLTQAEMMIALRTIAPQDLAAMNAWIDVHGEPDQKKTLMASLPALPIGDAWCWSPGWPTAEGIFQRVHVLPIETFDSGASPKPGVKPIEVKTLADVDLGALKTQMAETLERAKADDPKELKKRILDLERRLKESDRSDQKLKSSVVKSVDTPVLTDADRALLAELAGKFDALAARLDHRINLEPLHEMVMREIVNAHKVHDAVRADFLKILDGKRLQRIRQNVATVAMAAPAVVIPRNAPVFEGRDPKPQQNTRSAQTSESLRRDGHAGGSELGRCERALLTVLAQRNGSGTSRGQLAVLSGYSQTSSGFANALGRLRTLGYVNGMTITNDGRGAVGEIEPLPVGRELASHWIGQLPRAEATMLQALLAHPDGLDKDDLSRVTGYSATSSGFANAVGKLRTLELASKGWPVRASEELFS